MRRMEVTPVPHRVSSSLAVATLLTLLAACGGGSSPSSPSPTPTPAPPPAPSNRNPTITTTASTTFGVDSLTRFVFSASASDPDGDALSITWDLGDGTSASGAGVEKVYVRGGTFRVTAAADDGKGGRATGGGDVTVGSMTGTWLGSIPGYTNLRFQLAQNGTIVTGTFVEQFFGEGRTDPAAPGRIDADGRIEIRFKLSRFSDFIFRGRMDSSGRRITGGVFASGFNGEAFVMVKQ